MKKVYIDSNVIIRLLIKDVPLQLLTVQKLIKNIEEGKLTGLISILVINEILWILENYYNLKRVDFIPWLQKLLALKKIKIIETKKELVIKILNKMQANNIGFTDLYLAHLTDRKNILSFDLDFNKIH